MLTDYTKLHSSTSGFLAILHLTDLPGWQRRALQSFRRHLGSGTEQLPSTDQLLTGEQVRAHDAADPTQPACRMNGQGLWIRAGPGKTPAAVVRWSTLAGSAMRAAFVPVRSMSQPAGSAVIFCGFC
jgi:hypothetical protein